MYVYTFSLKWHTPTVTARPKSQVYNMVYMLVYHNSANARIDLTFCKLPGFNCVLSMIFIATYLHEKDVLCRHRKIECQVHVHVHEYIHVYTYMSIYTCTCTCTCMHMYSYSTLPLPIIHSPTSCPVGMCLASLTLAKFPLPIVLTSLYLPT